MKMQHTIVGYENTWTTARDEKKTKTLSPIHLTEMISVNIDDGYPSYGL